MTYSENAINILAVKTYKGIGTAWIVKNLKGNESTETIVALLNNNSKQNEIITIDDFELNKNYIKEKLSDFEDSCDGLIAIGDKNFPRYRGDVKESEQPIFLFYKGDIDLLDIDNNNITVIGLLNPDETIEARERKIVEEIIKRDITIVSGLAFGCDSIAHQQAIIGGKTIAILPSPLNDILPAKNRDLAFEIVEEGGLLITEYYEKFKSKMELSSRYKERDRLQALFCDTIILAASYAQDSATRWNIFNQKLDSGARLAMEYAKNYKIPRAVMYNQDTDIDNPMFDLNRQLILEEKNITILTQKNLEKMIDKIKEKRLHYNKPLSLFDQ
ncbi:MAG: DNA-binding protein [Erysipelotrichia bacterium]|nr:DNA-binding protein [Erysipelotrichia bacterium]